MSITKCQVCGRSISDSAPECPFCKKEAVPSSPKSVCTCCGTGREGDLTVCLSCGRSLSNGTVQENDSDIQVGATTNTSTDSPVPVRAPVEAETRLDRVREGGRDLVENHKGRVVLAVFFFAYLVYQGVSQPRSDDDVLIFVTIALSAPFVWKYLAEKRKKEEDNRKRVESRNREIDRLLTEAHFLPTYAVMMDNGIQIDTSSKQVCLIVSDNAKDSRRSAETESEFKFIPYDKLLTSQINEDGETVTTASSQAKLGSVVGRSIVGGLLLGGVGVVVGGLSGKRVGTAKTQRNVTKLELELIIDDLAYPVHRVCFLDMQPGDKFDKGKVRRAREEIYFWQILLELAMMGEDIPEDKTMSELMDYAKLIKARAERAQAKAQPA